MIVAEDVLSLAVLRRVIAESGRDFLVSREFQTRGYGRIKSGIPKFRNACKALPHIVLTDLDQAACPVALLSDWGAIDLPESMMLRVAVREVEAWLLADRKGIADFLGVAVTKVPQAPEQESDPKRCLLNLVRKGRKRRLAEDIAPAPGSSASIGPLYNQRLSAFVENQWQPWQACETSPSLARSLERLQDFLIY